MSDVLLVCADARKIPLPDNSVQVVVTSPPYWGLRKYAGDQVLVWGEKPIPDQPDMRQMCEHEWQTESKTVEIRQGAGLEELSEKYRGGGHSAKEVAEPFVVTRGTCARCGAWKGAYGLEPTIEMYVLHTLEILREIRRVLRPDGVVFWNLGDSYANDLKWGGSSGGKHRRGLHGQTGVGRTRQNSGLKPKDLVLMPERVALAAQADGWWVRARIIWNKRNPMPESVSDRPTDAHEHIWMLTKSQDYYWDCEAVRENVTGTAHSRGNGVHPKAVEHGQGIKANTSFSEAVRDLVSSRQLRNVWSFATQPYSGAHYATFPEELPRTCIKAATSQYGACSQCGAPWERILERTVTYESGSGRSGKRPTGKLAGGTQVRENHDIRMGPVANFVTLGWKPTCGCYEAHCPQCRTVLGFTWDEKPRTKQRRRKAVPLVQEEIPRTDRRLEVVQPGVRGSLAGEEPQHHDGSHGHDEGLCPDSQAGASGGEQGRLRDGAPPSGGEDARSLPETDRDSPPPEREEGRQPRREPRSDAQAGPRPDAEAEADENAAVPALRPDGLPLGLCRNCQCPLEFTGPKVVPNLVLDPFGGSGTTGQVAVSLNRNAVCLDLAYTHTYGELAKQRTSEVQRELML